MGYPPVQGDDEVATFDEFVAAFDWAKVNTVGPIFDLDKLNWLNGHYIRSLDPADLADRIEAYLIEQGTWSIPPEPHQAALLRGATPLIQERLTLLSEALPKLAFLYVADADLVIADDAKGQLKADAGAILTAASTALEAVSDFTAEAIEAALRATLVEGLGLKPRLAFTPVRIAITGQRVSPPLFESMALLGRAACVARIAALRRALD
jgi:glutamyl-tRNA synthetase